MSGPIDYTTLEDTELVARAREGDSRAFDELVIRHSRKLHATLYQMTDNYDDAYDIAQEAFSKAYRALRYFNGQSASYTWLHSIAVNHARNFLKKRNRRMTYSLDDDEYGDHTEKDMNMADETDGADPERRTHLNELQLKINEALKKLSTKHREVVVLHDVKGLNHTEISALLGISEGTLRSIALCPQGTLRDCWRNILANALKILNTVSCWPVKRLVLESGPNTNPYATTKSTTMDKQSQNKKETLVAMLASSSVRKPVIMTILKKISSAISSEKGNRSGYTQYLEIVARTAWTISAEL